LGLIPSRHLGLHFAALPSAVGEATREVGVDLRPIPVHVTPSPPGRRT
jgi:hypothetical protein